MLAQNGSVDNNQFGAREAQSRFYGAQASRLQSGTELPALQNKNDELRKIILNTIHFQPSKRVTTEGDIVKIITIGKKFALALFWQTRHNAI